ncbi:3-oxoacyl-[acyl-carrier-protein] synthase, KASII [Crocosphaera watsonii WH 8502]|nr:3-oxoacyl-[acyl-carrier-protein] synthase, KASII [Crocosphaera watsonii WH 8502]CCQ67323.1 3-oxoacyl-[acyl-carrier-protein] synthase,KASII [Crocosphaera watsonii WH 0402]
MLEKLLKMSTKKPSLNDIKLLEWMKQWKTIHQEINFQSSDYDNKQ